MPDQNGNLSNYEIYERRRLRLEKLAADNKAAMEANPYLARTDDRLRELRARAFDQAYGQQLRSTGFQQKQ